MARFLDTNILIRYLTNDDPVKAVRALALLDYSGPRNLDSADGSLFQRIAVSMSRKSHGGGGLSSAISRKRGIPPRGYPEVRHHPFNDTANRSSPLPQAL